MYADSRRCCIQDWLDQRHSIRIQCWPLLELDVSCTSHVLAASFSKSKKHLAKLMSIMHTVLFWIQNISIEPLRHFTLVFILKSSEREVMVTLKTTPVWTSPISRTAQPCTASGRQWPAQQWTGGHGSGTQSRKPTRNPLGACWGGWRGAGQQRVKKASGRSYFKEVILEQENGKLWGNFTNWWKVCLGKKYAYIVSLYWFI